MYCAKCGAEIHDDAHYCPRCGQRTELADAENPYTSPQTETPKGTASTSRRWLVWAAMAVVLVTLAVVIGVAVAGGDGETDIPPMADPGTIAMNPTPITTATPTTAPAPTTVSVPTTAAPTTAPEPSAEIWQWAVGRNVWTDTDLGPYARQLGVTENSAVVDHYRGFQLNVDPSGIVSSVTLYNDEAAVGAPYDPETNFRAYQGALPGGLNWDQTADDLGLVAGEESSGYGWNYEFERQTRDGYRVTIEIAADNEQDLPTAPMYSITVY